jgi:type III pantothenate kinase
MLLALDVGNTNTVLGLYKLDGEKPELAAHWRVTTHHSQTSDEYGVLFVNLFEMNGFTHSNVHHIIISSVVPPVESTLREVCSKYFNVQPLFVEPGSRPGCPCSWTIPLSWAQTGW